MTLAKIVVSGKVIKSPEKRFTQNNIAITSFVMDINPQEATIVRVMALGNLAEKIAESIGLGDEVIVEGRPQVEVTKMTNGKDKRVVEINASAVEKIGATTATTQAAPVAAAQSKDIVQFASEELGEELINEDEIPF